MLPAFRVIGHREYGNTPPGGWPGRKQDPVYDMNWRRGRVANFSPRGDDMPLSEQDLDRIRDRIWTTVADDPRPVAEGGDGPAWMKDRVIGMDHKTGVMEALIRAQGATIGELVKLVATDRDDLDEDALVARIDDAIERALAESVVQVDVSVAGKPAGA